MKVFREVLAIVTILTDGFKVAEHIRNLCMYFDLLSKVSLHYQMIFKDELSCLQDALTHIY